MEKLKKLIKKLKKLIINSKNKEIVNKKTILLPI